jgi:hypothetical protein
MIAEEATGEGPAWPALGSDEQQTDSVFVLICDPSSWPSLFILASSARHDLLCLIGDEERERGLGLKLVVAAVAACWALLMLRRSSLALFGFRCKKESSIRAAGQA